MKFLLEIELGNDGMQTIQDLAWALSEQGSLLTTASETAPRPERWAIHDRNGNTVGKWKVIDDTPTQAERDAMAKRLSEVI